MKDLYGRINNEFLTKSEESPNFFLSSDDNSDTTTYTNEGNSGFMIFLKIFVGLFLVSLFTIFILIADSMVDLVVENKSVKPNSADTIEEKLLNGDDIHYASMGKHAGGEDEISQVEFFVKSVLKSPTWEELSKYVYEPEATIKLMESYYGTYESYEPFFDITVLQTWKKSLNGRDFYVLDVNYDGKKLEIAVEELAGEYFLHWGTLVNLVDYLWHDFQMNKTSDIREVRSYLQFSGEDYLYSGGKVLEASLGNSGEKFLVIMRDDAKGAGEVLSRLGRVGRAKFIYNARWGNFQGVKCIVFDELLSIGWLR